MTDGKSRLGRNMGRVELYAVLNQVRNLQEAGYDLKKIHAQLSAAGQVHMSYATFCFQMAKLMEARNHPKPSLSSPQAAPSTRQRTSTNGTHGGGLVRQERDAPFTVETSPDLKDFI
jgi:hypothetical protein